ncbi:MAG: SPOR domain-containing protein [Gammaproteobacteria bacterium]
MHQRLKERLVGAAVLVVLAVIFIPMILTGPVDTGAIEETNIPAKPDEKFKPTLVPISGSISPVESVTREKSTADTDTTIIETAETDVAPATESSAAESGTETREQEPPEAEAQPAASPRPQAEKQKSDKPVGLSAWVVQLGSFSSKVNADKLNLSLRKEGFPAFVEPIQQDKKTIYRVRVGPELLRSDAEKLLKSINEKMKLKGIVLSYP